MKTPLHHACLAQALTCDGAMGTQLIEKGMTTGESGMKYNAVHL